MKTLPFQVSVLIALTLAGCGLPPHPVNCVNGACYQVVDGFLMTEGDVIVGHAEEEDALVERVRRGFAVHESAPWARWPRGRVPYVIHATLPNPDRVKQAIAHFHEKTNIRFIPRTTQAAYVVFRPWAQGYCRSWIGRTGSAQRIDLDAICDTRSVIHEIGHAVGLYHEHTRPDRNQYVRIHLTNVMAGMGWNFNIQREYARRFGAYDFASVMHYRATELSKNGQPTVTRLDGSTDLSNPYGLSAGDIATLKAMYPTAYP